MTMPMTTYGVMRMPRSDCFIASNSASDRVARAAESIGFRRAWMKFIATVQPPGGGGRVAHREDVRVRAGLQEAEAAGEDEVGDQERPIGTRGPGRDEQERARRVQAQAHQDAALVREAPDEDGGREGHRKVPAVEGDLREGALCYAHPEDLGERLHHRVRDVVRKAPQREARGDQNEWQ